MYVLASTLKKKNFILFLKKIYFSKVFFFAIFLIFQKLNLKNAIIKEESNFFNFNKYILESYFLKLCVQSN